MLGEEGMWEKSPVYRLVQTLSSGYIAGVRCVCVCVCVCVWGGDMGEAKELIIAGVGGEGYRRGKETD